MPLGILWTNCKVMNHEVLKQKDESMHIIMTGRWLPDALKPYVDSITTITTELTDQERE